jgi:hypothetical protein
MNKKQRKAKKIGAILLVLLALFNFVTAVIYGTREQWVEFGCSLGACIIITVFFTGIIIQLGADMRFNQLERLIESKGDKPKDEQKQ